MAAELHDNFIRRAIELAREHSAGGICGPFGAVVVRAGEIVGEGWNRVVEGQDPTAHAEVVAIRDACRRLGTHLLEGCEIYASCEPCPMCLAAIYWARIGRIYYACTREDAAAAGFDDAEIYRQLALPPDKRSISATCIDSPHGHQLFEAWLRNPKRVAY